MNSRRFTLCLGLILAVGCGPGRPELGEVSGIVMIDGKPIHGATVSFSPQAAVGSPSYGETDKQGRYSLGFTRKKTGAMLGTHDVTIETQKLSRAEAASRRDAGYDVPEYVEIPKRYRAPGTLTAEVEAGDNVIDFDLDSSK